ncbi:hypothetical protein BC939DRAFT_226862 [Gamsiella multidivaricata]|uniref:uncharacterized protein n=1 Tax=Gamsiella multidivaricata TaxID=101098 RepID=UPI00221FE3A5|nr:uncharacterized protein BC939DRAFT_226862 [Gamsiella multidivaricata]KAG0363730.1 hypothetical protein BGZ54_008062 [Gamsiella multidivaricata]KAI7831328.1 hypothetical protein BC939DRAFT_226862 [Gamsiella multidivaricata]
MSSFFGAQGSGSGPNANKSSSNTSGSSTGGGGWGSFLKQGLSTIESKLDMVLDINVPIPGGASGTLTSFSPHATVLPSSITGASSTKDTPPKKQELPRLSGRSDSQDLDEISAAEDDLNSRSKATAARNSGSAFSNKGEDKNQRTSVSVSREEGPLDDSKPSTSIARDDSTVTVDPFTGMVITTPGIMRMSTPPVSGGNSAAAAAAAANRERLEQRMRGIFKKTNESPSSAATTRSPAASPSPSVRQSISTEPEDSASGKEDPDKGNGQITNVVTAISEENAPSDDIDVAEDSYQEVKESNTSELPSVEASADAGEAVEKQEDKDANDEATQSAVTVDKTTDESAGPEQDPEMQTDNAKQSESLPEEMISEDKDQDINPIQQDREGSVTTEETITANDSKEIEVQSKEAEEAKDQEGSTDSLVVDKTELTPARSSLDNEPVKTTVPTQPTEAGPADSVSKEPAPVSQQTLDKVGNTQKTDKIVGSITSDENPLKKVLEQREEQLFKVMQEQSSLLERLRDLEDAKAAEDALKATKVAGLEKIIESQKKELEVARGSNLASQPKSIQKTLEEQRALLEEKDEQIRGLLEEGEVLSKKEFKYLTSIKTLRTKNIEAEKLQMDTQKKLDRALSDYTDSQAKLGKIMDENKQLNDSVKSLHDINQRQNKQMTKMEAELLQVKEEKANLQLGLDRARQELAEARKTSAELSNQAHAAALDREMKLNEDLNKEIDELKAQHVAVERNLHQEIQDLRVSLSNREELAGEKEDQLWMEIRSLQARLEQNDNDSYDLQEALDEARRPLLRQIEVLQNQQGAASRNWDKIEKTLTRRVTEAEEDVTKAQEREKITRDKMDELKSQSAALEARLETLRVADTQLRSEINANKRLLKDKEEETRQAQSDLAKERAHLERAIEEAKEDAERKLRLRQQTEIDKLKQQIQQLQKRQGTVDDGSEVHLSAGSSAAAPRPSSSSISATAFSSPMLAGGPLVMGGLKTALHGSGNGVRASFESITSPASLDGMPPSLSRTSSSQTMSGMSATASSMGLMGLGSGATGQAVAIERLNTVVRQLEGQVTFLSEQVRTANKNKDELSDELVRVAMELEELQKQAMRVPGLEKELALLQERYKAALEMLGERTEEVQELRADIVDVKEAYRDQINELLGQLEQSRQINAR